MRNKMKYVISSWKGFEIDSSEFWVTITSNDVPRLIKAFIESPFIEGGGGRGNDVQSLKNAIELYLDDLKEHPETSISPIATEELIEDKTLEEFVEDIGSQSYNLVDLAIAVKFLLEEFPHLAYEFKGNTITFYRKTAHEDVAVEYTFSITGAPVQYMTVWYEEEEWHSVLSSISKKAPVNWNTWI